MGDGHWKSVLVGMLDPITRQHTSSMMGSAYSAADLKRAILEFTSNMVLSSGDAMMLGQCGNQTENEKDENEWQNDDGWGNWEDP